MKPKLTVADSYNLKQCLDGYKIIRLAKPNSTQQTVGKIQSCNLGALKLKK